LGLFYTDNCICIAYTGAVIARADMGQATGKETGKETKKEMAKKMGKENV
jgi:hypothetical protein|tara:strand:- start:655 stop:804 length:150 start_codon:yes stop_codon:yes gene_type:complete